MKKINFDSILNAVKPFFIWGIVVYLVVLLFGFGGNREHSFWSVAIVLSLMYVIHRFGKQIDQLEKDVKTKEKIIKKLVEGKYNEK